jgi:alpha-L-fucosidase 2
MIREPKNNWLVTSPSSSPENAFYLPGGKESVFVCMGPTMDVQLVRELFENTLLAAEILNVEDKTIVGIKEAINSLPPMQISPNGYLQEWLEDYEEQDPKHRHVSHLYGLHPSNQISPIDTPELAAAARETLNRRGDAGTGWSRAWKVNFWARLHDGNRAYKLLKSLLEPTFDTDVKMGSGGGTYQNLFCAHPPFQIDGNFGGTAGIAEMLIQSQNDFIHILPALPDNWSRGKFSGLRVRGGAEVDAEWEENKLKNITITAQNDNTFKIMIPDYAKNILHNNKELQIDNGFISLEIKKDDVFNLEVIAL